MSRIGKEPITVPSGVTLSIEGATVTVKGPKGELKEVIDPVITMDCHFIRIDWCWFPCKFSRTAVDLGVGV